MTTSENLTPESRPNRVGLFVLFGAMYFIQGIAEPTEGMIAQPVRSLMDKLGTTATAAGMFAALLAMPWSLKPVFGLFTDFVPIAGTRRRSYLILCSAAACFGLALLYFVELPVLGEVAGRWYPQEWQDRTELKDELLALLTVLLIPTFAIAFTDVVVDGLMVEKTQPLGLTGQVQSVQWSCMSAGGILAGLAGGWLSQRDYHAEAFLICAVGCGLMLLISIFFVKEQSRRREPGEFRRAGRALWETVRNPALLAAGGFLFLWSFNPFSMNVIYTHSTQVIGLSDEYYGMTLSLFSVGGILGSLSYGLYCRRVPLRWLIHLSIVSGVLSVLAYMFVTGKVSAAIVSTFVGFVYMTGNLVQCDLVARTCPVATAGTSFAVLMSLSNFSLSISAVVGGYLYETWSTQYDAGVAFEFLVLSGAAATSACWLFLPVLQRAVERNDVPTV